MELVKQEKRPCKLLWGDEVEKAFCYMFIHGKEGEVPRVIVERETGTLHSVSIYDIWFLDSKSQFGEYYWGDDDNCSYGARKEKE